MSLLDDQRAAALAELTLYAQPDVPPTLDSDELTAILDGAQRAGIWTAATVYVVGAVVLPTVRNGSRYRITQAGTSGATEPTWSNWQGARGSDGADILWQEDGPDFENVFDIPAAIHAACEVKARKAAALTATGGAEMQQVYEHWRQEADRTRSVTLR